MAKEKFEQSKFEAPEEKADLTTAEGRQKEIEKIFEEGEEIKSEKSEAQLLEAINKQDKKIDAEIKEKSPWIREKIEKTANWYKKQPLWKKIVFSVGCVGAASASAAFGGAVGTAVATAAFTGSMGQRLLGGLATFVTAEGLLKKAAEKGGRERTKTEAIRHTVEAATLGILVGSGSAARAVREISEATGVTDILRESYRFWFPSGVQAPEIVSPKLGVKEALLQPEAPAKTILSTEAQQQPTGVKIEAPVEKIMDYQGGKSIWQEAGKQWETRFKEFADLGGGDSKTAEALKTYNIDRIKDTVADAIKSGDKDLIEKYGLAGISDPDTLTIDQLKGIKWSDVFEDTLKDEGLTEDLPSEKIESIYGHNAALREFFKEYPQAPKTSENYENILRGKGNTGVVPEAEPAPAKTPEAPAEAEIKAPTEIPTKPEIKIPLIDEQKLADLDKQITNIKTEYDQARLDLLEANVERHSPTREWSNSEELENYINSRYQKVEDLENQLKALNQNRDGLLKLTEEQIISPEMETGAVIEEAPKVLKEVSEISLAPEKAGILDNIIKDKFISDTEINQVWNSLKSNKLTSDDFIDYYSQKLNESGIRFKNDSVLRKGFKEIFNNYIKETDSALKAQIENGKIKPALKVLLNRLAKQ